MSNTNSAEVASISNNQTTDESFDVFIRLFTSGHYTQMLNQALVTSTESSSEGASINL